MDILVFNPGSGRSYQGQCADFSELETLLKEFFKVKNDEPVKQPKPLAERIADILKQVPDGIWATTQDISELTKTDSDSVRTTMQKMFDSGLVIVRKKNGVSCYRLYTDK